jgi:hypothetical protein
MQDTPKEPITLFDPELDLIGRSESFKRLEGITSKICRNCGEGKATFDFALVPVERGEGGYTVHNAIGHQFLVKRDEYCKKCRRKITRAEQARYLRVIQPKVTKKCMRCKEVLPVTSFGKDSSRPAGLSSRCKQCHSAHYKEYRSKHPDEQKRYQLVYRLRKMIGDQALAEIDADILLDLVALKQHIQTLKDGVE